MISISFSSIKLSFHHFTIHLFFQYLRLLFADVTFQWKKTFIMPSSNDKAEYAMFMSTTGWNIYSESIHMGNPQIVFTTKLYTRCKNCLV